jgi:hypothetical protein
VTMPTPPLEPTRIGFSTTDHLSSRLIRALSGSEVSHAFLVYRDADFGRDMVMEAVARGFRIVPFDKFQQHNRVVALYAPLHPIEDGLRAAVDWLGDEYDVGGLLGMAVVALRRWLERRVRNLRNPLASSRSLFCSEAVARACVASRYPGFDLDPESTSPQDLYAFFAREAAAGVDPGAARAAGAVAAAL